jgi:hypothetical protein
MQYTDAFKKLGYRLSSPRQDWSAGKTDGVCISIWRNELDRTGDFLRYDLWALHPNPQWATWMSKPGQRTRTAHLQRVMDEFGGKVDVVLVTGKPGESYESAEPWLIEKRGAGWRIIRFEPTNGYFISEVDARSKS